VEKLNVSVKLEKTLTKIPHMKENLMLLPNKGTIDVSAKLGK